MQIYFEDLGQGHFKGKVVRKAKRKLKYFKTLFYYRI
jgi:hypothetical protein